MMSGPATAVATGETQLAQAGNARLASLDHGRSQDRSRAMLVRTILYLYTVAFVLNLLLERPESISIAGP
jgi:hypothetical protein